jgi:hypothetical protein
MSNFSFSIEFVDVLWWARSSKTLVSRDRRHFGSRRWLVRRNLDSSGCELLRSWSPTCEEDAGNSRRLKHLTAMVLDLE